MNLEVYSYIYVEYGDSCDGYPRGAARAWWSKEEAFSAMEQAAKDNTWDTSYWYKVEGNKNKIVILDGDDNNEQLIMSMTIVKFKLPDSYKLPIGIEAPKTIEKWVPFTNPWTYPPNQDTPTYPGYPPVIYCNETTVVK